MEDLVLHKVAFTDESVFDYEHCLTEWQDGENASPLVKFPKREIKEELEEYIQYNTRLKHKHYFRVNYYDMQLDQMLMLFIRRGARVSIMQNWTVLGICPADCWTEDLEYDGIIRFWYEKKISDLPDTDWVETLRIKAEIEKLTAELEEIKESEHDIKIQQEHDRRFGNKRAKGVPAQQKPIASDRKRIQSELRILAEQLRTTEGKTGIH